MKKSIMKLRGAWTSWTRILRAKRENWWKCTTATHLGRYVSMTLPTRIRVTLTKWWSADKVLASISCQTTLKWTLKTRRCAIESLGVGDLTRTSQMSSGSRLFIYASARRKLTIGLSRTLSETSRSCSSKVMIYFSRIQICNSYSIANEIL